MMRVAPLSGLLLMAGALALAGFPPFNVFVSEFMIFAAGVKGRLSLADDGLRACSLPSPSAASSRSSPARCSARARRPSPRATSGWLALTPMASLFGLVLILGVAVPRRCRELIQNASAIVLGEAAPVALAAPWQILPCARRAHGSSQTAQPRTRRRAHDRQQRSLRIGQTTISALKAKLPGMRCLRKAGRPTTRSPSPSSSTSCPKP